MDITDMPRGKPMETLLTPEKKPRFSRMKIQAPDCAKNTQRVVKRRAKRSSRAGVKAVKPEATDASTPSSVMIQYEDPPSPAEAVELIVVPTPDMTKSEDPPSPAEAVELIVVPTTDMSVDIEASCSSPTNSSTLWSKVSNYSRASSGEQYDESLIRVMRQGSEDESEGSDEDDNNIGCIRLPKLTQILMDTPDDPAPDTTMDFQLEATPPYADAISETATAANKTTGMKPNNFLDFEWRPYPEKPIPPELRRETFCKSNAATTPLYDPYDLFVAMWDREFLSHVVVETNRYVKQVLARMKAENNLYPSSRICKWVDTSIDELYTYFAMLIAMGIVVRSQITEYWCASKNIFATPGFRVHMSLRRFQLLSNMLHFNNNKDMCKLNLNVTQAKLFKLQPVLDNLNRNFSDMYVLRQNLALDESLLQWNGWLDINQYIPNKAASVGIKSYELCESQTGYLWRFEIYSHKNHEEDNAGLPPQLQGATSRLVLRLLKGLEFRGHTVWMDNFYNSPALARKLKSLGFDCVGTLRTNRQLVPVELANLSKSDMKPGQLIGCTSGDVDLLVWRDHNRVALISTYHGNAVSSDKGVLKPILVTEYNTCMTGVDKKDQMLAMYPMERKRTKIWYKKLFRRLLNTSIQNCYIIHKESSAVAKLSHRNFRIQLVQSLLVRHSSSRMPPPPKVIARDVILHCPAEYPFLPHGKSRLRRVCSVCKSRTPTYCKGCDKSVCVFKCWSDLHKPEPLERF